MNYHKPDTGEAEAKAIIAALPHDIVPVLITYLEDAAELYKFMKYLGVEVVQLHSDISPIEAARLKQIFPECKIIKSLVVHEDKFQSIELTISEFTGIADYFITDTFDASTGASGATGKTHDAEISRRAVEISNVPLILAGGLNCDNVAQRVKIVRPIGVDVHTGIEDSNGDKTRELSQKFVSEARKGFE